MLRISREFSELGQTFTLTFVSFHLCVHHLILLLFFALQPNMANLCILCASTANVESIQCYGVCENHFHIACLASKHNNKHIKKGVLQFIGQMNGLHWYCEACEQYTLTGAMGHFTSMVKSHVKNMLTSADLSSDQQQNQTIDSPNVETEQTGETEEAPSVASTSHAAASAFQQIPATVSATESSTSARTTEYSEEAMETNGIGCENLILSLDSADTSDRRLNPFALKRRIDDFPLFSATKRPRQRAPVQNSATRSENSINNIEIDTRSSSSAVNLASQVCSRAASVEKLTRDVYISNFNPSTTTDDIMQHLKLKSSTRLFAEEVVCAKLVRRGRFLSMYTFVSFKLTVPSKYFSRVVNASLWPKGVVAKEFVEPSEHRANRSLTSNKENRGTQPKNKDRASRYGRNTLNALVQRQQQRPNQQQHQHRSQSQVCCNHIDPCNLGNWMIQGGKGRNLPQKSNCCH